jgi:hypothetical protein
MAAPAFLATFGLCYVSLSSMLAAVTFEPANSGSCNRIRSNPTLEPRGVQPATPILIIIRSPTSADFGGEKNNDTDIAERRSRGPVRVGRTSPFTTRPGDWTRRPTISRLRCRS